MLAKTVAPESLKEEVETWEGSWAQWNSTRPAPKFDARLAEFRRLHPEVKGDVFRVGPAGEAFEKFCIGFEWARGLNAALLNWKQHGLDTFDRVFAAVEG